MGNEEIRHFFAARPLRYSEKCEKTSKRAVKMAETSRYYRGGHSEVLAGLDKFPAAAVEPSHPGEGHVVRRQQTIWHAVYVGYRREWSAADALRARGCDAVCPMIERDRRVRLRGGSHYLRRVREPAYPRYVLASSSGLHQAIDQLRLRPSLAGPLRVVRMGDVPSPLGNIAALLARTVWREEAEPEAAPVRYAVGESVVIDEAAGIVGIITSIKELESRGSITVAVHMFGSRRETKLYVARQVSARQAA